MVRPLRADGTPYPRKRPIDWGVVRHVLVARKDHRAAIEAGFIEVTGFAPVPWRIHNGGPEPRIVETRIGVNADRLYVKVIPGKFGERR